ncbi:MAG: ATP-binding protein [Kiritimatiellae bacterium]|nr:ATP-binding protein [Kiritimatiellia bacterium]
MIDRELGNHAKSLFERYPVLTITGPRQSGKTVLAKACFGERLAYVNLEAPDIREYASQDPRAFLADHPDGAILDEIQRVPDLPSYIQVIVDEKRTNGLYVLTGSRQFEVHEAVSQSLAGRTAVLQLLPLTVRELEMLAGEMSVDAMLVGGFMPRIYDQRIPPSQALSDYVATYVERDLRQLLAVKDLDAFQRFLGLCAGRTGQLLNLSSLGNDAGVSHTTAQHWISLLRASYVVYLLQPYHRNVGKRLIKSPKLYFHDVGLAAYLCGIDAQAHLKNHPLRGSLFENMVVGETLKFFANRGRKAPLHFYRDSSGLEVDLLIDEGGSLLPVEVKASHTPAQALLKGLHRFRQVEPDAPYGRMLVYGGDQRQERTDLTVTTVRGFARDLERLLAS